MGDKVEKSSTGNSDEIWVNEFTEKSAQEFREAVLERAEKDPNIVIPIYIDSYGGYVDALAKMIETMDEVPNRFLTVCMGKAMSCGAILLSHGDLRFCGKYSRVMIHNVSSVSWGDVYSMKAGSDEGMRLNKIFMGLLARNCGLTYEQLQNNIKAATDSKEIWLSAEDSLKFGIVDLLGVPEITPIVQWTCDVAPDKPRLRVKKPTATKKTTSAKKKKRRSRK
jgi:ATP-dependent Clp endopeptidase proteolytic subunit ClpP